MESVLINDKFLFDVVFEYVAGRRTNEINDPPSIEILSVYYHDDMMDLFEYYNDAESLMDAIRQKIFDTRY
jgi:hypothetical protein